MQSSEGCLSSAFQVMPQAGMTQHLVAAELEGLKVQWLAVQLTTGAQNTADSALCISCCCMICNGHTKVQLPCLYAGIWQGHQYDMVFQGGINLLCPEIDGRTVAVN